MTQKDYDTFLNKVWDNTVARVPEKVYAWGIGLAMMGYFGSAIIDKIQEHHIEQKLQTERIAYENHMDNLVAKEDSLLNYGLTLVQQGNLDEAENILFEAGAVRPNYVVGRNLEKAIRDARVQREQNNKLLALRLEFAGNEYFATEEAHTLWDIAPIYYEALTGHAPKTPDERALGNLWMDMVKYRRSLGKDTETIAIGEKVELPAKGLTEVLDSYKGHPDLSF